MNRRKPIFRTGPVMETIERGRPSGREIEARYDRVTLSIYEHIDFLTRCSVRELVESEWFHGLDDIDAAAILISHNILAALADGISDSLVIGFRASETLRTLGRYHR